MNRLHLADAANPDAATFVDACGCINGMTIFTWVQGAEDEQCRSIGHELRLQNNLPVADSNDSMGFTSARKQIIWLQSRISVTLRLINL